MVYLITWSFIAASTLVFKLVGSRVVPDESWFWSAQVLLGLFFLCFMNQGRSPARFRAELKPWRLATACLFSAFASRPMDSWFGYCFRFAAGFICYTGTLVFFIRVQSIFIKA